MVLAFYLALQVGAESSLRPATCEVSRCVRVPAGYMQVPCELVAFRSPYVGDSPGGKFESQDHTDIVEWGRYDPGYFLPLQSYVLALHNVERVIWRWPAIHGPRLWWHALIEFAGKQYYIITDGVFSLMVQSSSRIKLGTLVELAETYRVGTAPTSCEMPEVAARVHAF